MGTGSICLQWIFFKALDRISSSPPPPPPSRCQTKSSADWHSSAPVLGLEQPWTATARVLTPWLAQQLLLRSISLLSLASPSCFLSLVVIRSFTVREGLILGDEQRFGFFFPSVMLAVGVALWNGGRGWWGSHDAGRKPHG